MKLRHLRSAPLAVALSVLATTRLANAQTPDPAPPTPTPSTPAADALEGRVIGEIRIVTADIFDTSDPREDKWLFRLANRLHIQTRPGVIERALLFKSGERYSSRVIEETERALRANRYLYDMHIQGLPRDDGTVDIEVRTRDTWSLDLGASASRQGGTNSTGIGLSEYNLLGTGVTLGLSRGKNVDRTTTSLRISGDRMFGTRASVGLNIADNSDGKQRALSVVRPFYELDARWTAGVTLLDDDRVENVYNAGQLVSQYRHRQQQAEVFGGWSAGLVDGRAQRWSAGLRLNDDRYAPEPGLVAPAQLPVDLRLAGPFVRYEFIEDRFERELNRNLIGRPEYFALGLHAVIDLGRASRSFGSSQDAWTYRAGISRGYESGRGLQLIGSAHLSGEYWNQQVHRRQLGAQVQLYLPQSPRRLFYASAAFDTLLRPDPANNLQLGGENGLRGYPLRYQSGNHRALFTVEERFYTDLYVWRLFRIGGAAFLDVGRAWEGGNQNAANSGWLGNAGLGLRIVNSRSAFSSVLHVDVAMPLNGAADVKKLQLLVKTKASF